MKLAQTLLRQSTPLARWAAGTAAKRTIMMGVNPSMSFLMRSPTMAQRSFASHAQTNLLTILSREEKEEIETGNTEMPQELASLKSDLEKDWKIVEDGATTSMILKEKKVRISFHCQDTIEAEEYMEEYEDGEEPIDPVRFCVTVSKAGKTFVVNCVSDHGELKIETVVTTASTADEIHANQGDLVDDNQYEGPDFLELAEDLQEAVFTYLEQECGVDADVVAFVTMYADYKEQQQYVQFLKDVQSIIS